MLSRVSGLFLWVAAWLALSPGLALAAQPAPAAPPRAAAPAAPAAPTPAGPSPVAPAAAAQKPIGFSNLVVRVDKSDEIGLAGADFRVHILEELRRLGFNAVGAENLVFGNDNGQRADLLLGGTITALECKSGAAAKTVTCRIGIEWQVMNVASDEVVYKLTARSKVTDMAKEPVASIGRALVLGALRSLTKRAELLKLLKPLANAPSTTGYSKVTLKGCTPEPRSMPAASEQVLNATVLVQTSGGFGSGFVLGPEGYLLTAAHVVPGSSAAVRLRDGREFPATVIRADRRLDVALLRLAVPQGTELPCLSAKLDPMAIGADLYAIGSPASRELSFSLARGIVSGVRLLDGVQYLQTDAAINRGNSGGPLIDTSGQAVALVNFKLVGATMEGLAFGVPLAASLNALAVSVDAATSPELASAGAMPAQAAHTAFVDTADPTPDLSAAPLTVEQKRAKGSKTALLVVGGLGLGLGVVALFAGASNDNQDAKAAGWAGIGLGGLALIIGGSLP